MTAWPFGLGVIGYLDALNFLFLLGRGCVVVVSREGVVRLARLVMGGCVLLSRRCGSCPARVWCVVCGVW